MQSGEHGGDPNSIRFFDSVGIDYVSCSPFRSVETKPQTPNPKLHLVLALAVCRSVVTDRWTKPEPTVAAETVRGREREASQNQRQIKRGVTIERGVTKPPALALRGRATDRQ